MYQVGRGMLQIIIKSTVHAWTLLQSLLYLFEAVFAY